MRLERYVEPLASFARRALARPGGFHAPYRALFLTYDFNIELFERDVLPVLTRRNRAFRVVVIRDANTPVSGRPSASYELRSASVKGGTFHPKLWLLQAGPRWCVGIGSSNLTPGGFGGNLEVMSVTEGDPDRDEVPAAVRTFIRELSESKMVSLDKRTRQVLRTFCGSATGKPSVGAISTLRSPLLKQMAASLGSRRVTAVHLVSPPYAGQVCEDAGVEIKILGAFRDQFPGAELSVYTQATGKLSGAQTFSYPPPEIVASVSSDDENGDAEEELPSDKAWPSKLHAKMYLFETARGPWRFYAGSANLTVPALLTKPGHSGNVELVRGEDLSPREGKLVVAELRRRFSPVLSGTFKVRKSIRQGDGNLVLSGWEENGRIFIGLKTKSRSTVVIQSTKGVRVAISANGDSLVLGARQLVRLGVTLPLGVPVRLEEMVGTHAYPFFVSPCVVAPVTTGSTLESHLTSIADELDGVRIGPKTRRATPEPPVEPAIQDDDDDPLKRLTITDHDGELDRTAKLLARIIRSKPMIDDLRAQLRAAHPGDSSWERILELAFPS